MHDKIRQHERVLTVTVAGWMATIAAITGLLVLDWVALGRRPHEVHLAEAARWSVLYVAVSVLFGVVFALLNGWDLGAQYFAGYVVEKSLSVDNLFVFVIIIGSFAVPAAQRAKVLTIGIVIALVLRAAFIALGAALLELFSFMFLIFGLTLLATAVQLFRHRREDPDVGDNVLVTLARRALPMSTHYDGAKILTRERGRRVLTPLFLALLAIGSTDLLFAFDSIPAVFGVTSHAYIVFAANAFALLGLRPLFFLGLRDARAARLHVDRPGDHPRLRRRKAGLGVRAPRASLDSPDIHGSFAGRDPARAGTDDPRQRVQIKTRRGTPRPRWIAKTSPPGRGREAGRLNNTQRSSTSVLVLGSSSKA